MKKILLIILAIMPLRGWAQRMEVYTYKGFEYLALYSYGLQREVVKTNSQMREAQTNGDGTGIVKRHHTTKGLDERIGDQGYNVNDKLTFAFIVAPYNVDIHGDPTSDADAIMSWAEASGWDTSLDTGDGESYNTSTGVGVGESILASEPTGCAAYRGPNDADNPGDWRLPTQREMQVMFTVIEQALGSIASGEVESEVVEGVYWTSTEFFTADAPGYAWSLNTITGRPMYELKSVPLMVRCIKDIYESINE